MSEEARVESTNTNQKPKKGSRAPLIWLLILSAGPYLLATIYYQYRDVFGGSTSNYGQLVQPVVNITGVTFNGLDGNDTKIEELQRKWLMLYIVKGECDETCQKNIYYMRQVRKGMAEDRYRVKRIVLLDNKDSASIELANLREYYKNLFITRMNKDSQDLFYSTLHKGVQEIYGRTMLIDPFGNLMMEYEPLPDPKKMNKDLRRLLDLSRVG